MARVAVDINQLNRAIIMVGSRVELANVLGKAPSYISYIISSGEIEEEEAEHIAKKFNIDVILGDTRLLGTEVVPKMTQKVDSVRSSSSGSRKYDFDTFFEHCCERDSEKESLINDLYVAYVLFNAREGIKYVTRCPFESAIRKVFKFACEDRIVSNPFDYMPAVASNNYKVLKRTVVKGITLRKNVLCELLKSEFYQWEYDECESCNGNTSIMRLLESYNAYYSHSIDVQTFKALLSFVAIPLKCNSGSKNSTLCHGIKLKTDVEQENPISIEYIQEWLNNSKSNRVCAMQIWYECFARKREPTAQEIRDIHSIMNTEIVGWISTGKQRVESYGIQRCYRRESEYVKPIKIEKNHNNQFELLLAEQRRTNELLEELISIWR